METRVNDKLAEPTGDQTVRDCNNLAAPFVAVRTKVINLLLTGQCVNLHGILGVPITAISTCKEKYCYVPEYATHPMLC